MLQTQSQDKTSRPCGYTLRAPRLQSEILKNGKLESKLVSRNTLNCTSQEAEIRGFILGSQLTINLYFAH